MRARLQLWTKDQGGRHTPIFDDYRPRFVSETADLGVAVVKLPPDQPMMLPGTEADVTLEPADASQWGAVGPGTTLSVYEDTRQVGTATVLAQ
jgi:translation elongation factor EF-Tu-like GTPase